MNILLMEDDAETASYIITNLRLVGHTLHHALDGSEGLEKARGEQFDLMIVDRMLPKLDGLNLVRNIRSSGNNTPVLFLSNLDGVDDRVSGLDAGGDDYLTKPFALAELLARINAISRRSTMPPPEMVLTVGDLRMDLISRSVYRGEIAIDLLPREWQLLEYLVRNAGRIVTRSMLLHEVWDFHFDPHTNVVETHVSRLRQKVDRAFTSDLIHTVRGAGYTIRAQA